MEQAKRISFIKVNSTCFAWCFGLPVFAFMIALSLVAGLSGGEPGAALTARSLREFLNYYNTHVVDEFLKIFLNNYLAVLVIVYFTPLVLGLRKILEKCRNKQITLSKFDKVLLYLFPGIFLVRQAVNIAIIANSLASHINKNVIVTLTGIILPHGLPELLAFSLAGAVGMEVTRKLLFSTSQGRLVSGKVLGSLVVFIALCAFLEVYFTPKVFAVIMSAT